MQEMRKEGRPSMYLQKKKKNCFSGSCKAKYTRGLSKGFKLLGARKTMRRILGFLALGKWKFDYIWQQETEFNLGFSNRSHCAANGPTDFH